MHAWQANALAERRACPHARAAGNRSTGITQALAYICLRPSQPAAHARHRSKSSPRIHGTWRGNNAEHRKEDACHAQPQPGLLGQSCVRTPEPALGHAPKRLLFFFVKQKLLHAPSNMSTTRSPTPSSRKGPGKHTRRGPSKTGLELGLTCGSMSRTKKAASVSPTT